MDESGRDTSRVESSRSSVRRPDGRHTGRRTRTVRTSFYIVTRKTPGERDKKAREQSEREGSLYERHGARVLCALVASVGAGERTKGVTWVAPRWSLSSARIDTSSGGSPPHLPRRCWCAKVLVRIQGVCTRASTCRRGAAACACVQTERSVPAPPNGRGRRECWRAATRRLRRCRGSSSLPLRPIA